MEDFEKFWLKKARAAWKTSSEIETGTLLEKVRSSVEKLSDLFTINRPDDGDFRDYMNDPKLLAAYGLFFFPQSFARARFVLERLLSIYDWCPEKSDTPLRILDLGSGAAPCGFAAAQVLRLFFPKREIVITALDRSQSAVRTAEEIAKMINERQTNGVSINAISHDLKKLTPAKLTLPPQDLILLGWSLNEVVPANNDATAFLKTLEPLLSGTGAIVVLEPALKITAERLQKTSDFFATHPGDPLFRLAPEIGEHPCPLLREGIFWNHEVRKWTPPETLEFLNRTLFRGISNLKFSWCALGKKAGRKFVPPEGAAAILRLVSPLETTKAYLRFVGVNPCGEKVAIEIPTRGLSKSAVKKMAVEWERGDIVILAGTLSPIGVADHFRFAGTLKKI